jgi:hypothetical protein
VSLALNYVLYQVGWLACVFGAAWSYPWAGSALGAVTLATHVVLAERRLEELRLACLVGIIGACVESLQMAVGTIAFVSAGSVVSWLPPAWLVVLWMQFAGTLRFSLRWLTHQPVAAMTFGAIGGPLVYAGVSRLGIVRFHAPQWQSLLLLAVLWAAAMGVATWAARRNSHSGTGRYRI